VEHLPGLRCDRRQDAAFAELYRVLAPVGRMQIADVTIQNPVSEEGRRNIDLWIR
jgi:ubiquinone/menaquinone biosynthesis C-methylase UbiE